MRCDAMRCEHVRTARRLIWNFGGNSLTTTNANEPHAHTHTPALNGNNIFENEMNVFSLLQSTQCARAEKQRNAINEHNLISFIIIHIIRYNTNHRRAAQCIMCSFWLSFFYGSLNSGRRILSKNNHICLI